MKVFMSLFASLCFAMCLAKTVTASNVDLKFLKAEYDDHVNGGSIHNLPYSVYPYSQVRELTMVGVFLNQGSSPATNVEFKVIVYDGQSNVIWSDSVSMASLQVNSSGNLNIPGFTPPIQTAEYTLVFELTSDSLDADPSNNVEIRYFSVDHAVYGLDQGARSGGINNNGQDFQVGNTFWVENPALLMGFQVAVTDVAGGTDAGSYITGNLYDANLDYIDFASDHEIQLSEMTSIGGANWITIPFDVPVFLNAGEEYLIALEHFGGSLDVTVATSGTSPAGVSLFKDGWLGNWYWVSDTPMIRAIFDSGVGFEEFNNSAISLGQIFPNPHSGRTSIPYTLHENANVALEVYDVSGKLVHSQNMGFRMLGESKIEVDLSYLNTGFYLYSIIANDQRVQSKMSILK